MRKLFIATLAIFMLGIFNMNAQTGTGLYQLWYEYGNGTFLSKSFATEPILIDYLSTSVPAISPTPIDYAMKKVTPHYKPPTSLTKSYAVRGTDAMIGSYLKTPLPNEKVLHVHSSTQDFLSNDTILLALNYKKTNSEIKKMAFFYNSNPNNSFVAINNITNEIEVEHDNSREVEPLRQIRTHNNEVVSLPSLSLMTTVGDGFANGIVFDLSNIIKNETNVFVTLNTLEEILMENDERFKLVFLDSENNPISSESSNLINHSQLRSHDPNYQKVKPECVIFPIDGGKILHYDVHFQNTGDGPAKLVETTTTLPIGYSIFDIQNINNLYWEVAKIPRNGNYSIDVSYSAGDKLIIKFVKNVAATDILKGVLGMVDPINNVTTMGDFSFDLKLKSPLLGPQYLVSSTSIVFDDNDAVVTNESVVRVRACCTCDESSPRNNKNNKKCKLCRSKRWFWKWLLCEDC